MASSSSDPVRIFLAGDVMLGRGVDQVMPHRSEPPLREPHVDDARTYVELAEDAHGRIPAPVDFAYVWGDGLSVLEREKPAASIVNLETSVTVSSDFWQGKSVHYRMHPLNVGCLAQARVDVCVLANNHVLDFGRSGLAETLLTLREHGIAVAGAGRDIEEAARPARVDVRPGTAVLTFAFGSTSSGIPRDWAAGPSRPGVNLLPDLSEATADAIASTVRRAKRSRDLAVASIHWGSNWGWEIPEEQIAFAHRLIDGGVDLVHGHSSHHVRPFEIHAGRLILYGCGDLVTDYEGISGEDRLRGDLGMMYFASVSPEDGALDRLDMAPMQMTRMSLRHADPEGVEWLEKTLNRIGARFGTRVGREGRLLVLRHASHR